MNTDELLSRDVVIKWLELSIEWLKTQPVDEDDPNDEEERAKDVLYFRSALEYVRHGKL